MTLTKLLHDITQNDYQIQFCSDFEGMIRLEFRKEYDETYYAHEHLGFPGCPLERLEVDISKSLQAFLDGIEAGLENPAIRYGKVDVLKPGDLDERKE